MIDPARFLEICDHQGVDFFTGVPDSLLKDLNTQIMAGLPGNQHVIAANEGAAVGIAIGHYLRTGRPAAVYLQNSGFGNLVNPLLSLADPEVYGIPMLVVVGWRGKAGVKDEPQHVKQGRVMPALLHALEFPWSVLPKEPDAAEQCLKGAVASAVAGSCPYVLMVEKGTFGDPSLPVASTVEEGLASREEALTALVDAVGQDVVIVSTTGMLSRELFERRELTGGDSCRDFLTVGGMGHASSIALGIAMNETDREVWCLDGDGALLMHFGSLAVIANHARPNYFHVMFNNGVHDSVGGQPTSINKVDVPAAARALGYRYAKSVSDPAVLAGAVAELRGYGGPAFMEIRVRAGSRPDLGRPTRTPGESKLVFMAALGAR
jgi:phosphonopyruvate decarboxylase